MQMEKVSMINHVRKSVVIISPRVLLILSKISPYFDIFLLCDVISLYKSIIGNGELEQEMIAKKW